MGGRLKNDTSTVRLFGFWWGVFGKCVRQRLNYYYKVDKMGLSNELRYADVLLVKWIRNKYRIRGKRAAIKKLIAIYAEQPKLFVHWQFGIRIYT